MNRCYEFSEHAQVEYNTYINVNILVASIFEAERDEIIGSSKNLGLVDATTVCIPMVPSIDLECKKSN